MAKGRIELNLPFSDPTIIRSSRDTLGGFASFGIADGFIGVLGCSAITVEELSVREDAVFEAVTASMAVP